MIKKIYSVSLTLIVLSVTSFAQPGTLDTTFNTNYFSSSQVRTSAIQSNGKIIIGGDFITYNGPFIYNISRLKVDGSVDTLFVPEIGPNDYILNLAIQSDDKILIAGAFTSYDSVPRNHIARLNADGTLDTTFTPGIGANYDVWSISIQNDGKIIIGGDFTHYNGIPMNKIARLNIDGSLDQSFNVGAGASYQVTTSKIQSDGKIIIGGEFSSYNGINRNHIARLNIDGSLDTSFDPGSGTSDNVFNISIQNDGKIIIGGAFQTYNGTTVNYLARLNSDGTIDPNFNSGTGPGSWVYTIAIQNNGKILIGGFLSDYNGITSKKLARLNSDGSLDQTFNPGNGANGTVYTFSLQTDNKIIIGGGFDTYNGITKNNIARLQNNIFDGLNSISNEHSNYKIYPNPSDGVFTLESDDLSTGEINVYTFSGALVLSAKKTYINNINIDISDQPNGLYIMEVIQKSNSKRFKISKQWNQYHL